ncbi:MAG TPA: hypothetical protein VJA23_01840 [Candidatus Nanoarchaeia archaeon]|nr:hypothetical protein [Candidatus Nanoarchaeia archaeon]
MAKKCILCDGKAKFKIKDSTDFYCQDCAEDSFSDLDLLVKVEEEAQQLKRILQEKMNDLSETEQELDSMLEQKKSKLKRNIKDVSDD